MCDIRTVLFEEILVSFDTYSKWEHSIFQLESEKEKADNALVTTDAYRMAFEEQLSRNRTLVKQIAELVALPCPQPSKASKVKAALKWLVKQLNEGKFHVVSK